MADCIVSHYKLHRKLKFPSPCLSVGCFLLYFEDGQFHLSAHTNALTKKGAQLSSVLLNQKWGKFSNIVLHHLGKSEPVDPDPGFYKSSFLIPAVFVSLWKISLFWLQKYSLLPKLLDNFDWNNIRIILFSRKFYPFHPIWPQTTSNLWVIPRKFF